MENLLLVVWGNELIGSFKLVLKVGDPSPLSVYLGGHDIIYMIKWTRPSPSVSACCKQSKLDGGKAQEPRAVHLRGKHHLQ